MPQAGDVAGGDPQHCVDVDPVGLGGEGGIAEHLDCRVVARVETDAGAGPQEVLGDPEPRGVPPGSQAPGEQETALAWFDEQGHRHERGQPAVGGGSGAAVIGHAAHASGRVGALPVFDQPDRASRRRGRGNTRRPMPGDPGGSG